LRARITNPRYRNARKYWISERSGFKYKVKKIKVKGDCLGIIKGNLLCLIVFNRHLIGITLHINVFFFIKEVDCLYLSWYKLKNQIVMRVINAISLYKSATLFLVIAFSCLMCFSYILYNDSLQTKKTLIDQKNALIVELTKFEDSLELGIAENSSLKGELIIERQKVNVLLNEINNTNINLASLLKYKREMIRLKDLVVSLKKDKFQLQLNNELLKKQRDSTILILSQAIKFKDTLLAMNENLNGIIKKGSKVSIINLKTVPLRQLRNGDYQETNEARKTKVLKISFLVIGNRMEKTCEKEYCVQIIDSKNNVIGKKIRKKYDDMVLDYSYASNVKFINETLEVTSNLELEGLEKGNYFVNIFDRGVLTSKTTFALR